MRINIHTHVFNFRSVFTEQTVNILLDRIGSEDWPPFVMEAVKSALMHLLKGEYMDEEALLKQLVKHLSRSRKAKNFGGSLGKAIPADVSVLLSGNIDDLAVDALHEILRKLGDIIDDNRDAENRTLSDLVDFLAIGIQPTIHEVARTLMRQSGDGTVVAALMMDITTGGTKDEKLFLKQIEDTSAAALAFPGWLLPFVAVNPLRTSHFERMEMALNQRGFVGVKLYPSLGYDVDSKAMRNVYAFCEANEIPLLMHCGPGGFCLNKQTALNSDPGLWRAILKDYPTLRICFGHFGGDSNLTQDVIPADSWTKCILDLMKTYKGVYADIAYHTDPMAGGAPEANYFKNLGSLLGDPAYGDRILFGSDFFMVRQRLREDTHWRYFESKFSAPQFRLITFDNPSRFLGLPSAGGFGAAKNIRKYIDFLVGHKDSVGSEPAAWALAAVKRMHGDITFKSNPWGVSWTKNNAAHWYTWRFFNNEMGDLQRRLSFEDAAGVLVRQLPGWPSSQVAVKIREGRLRELAAALQYFLTSGNIKAKPEPGVTRRKSENELLKLFTNGDTKLAEFGDTVDKLFRFAQEGK